MKKCVTCGAELNPEAPYCPQCGTSVLLMQSAPMMTGSKGLDALVGFFISFGLMFGSGVLLALLATLGVTGLWVYYIPVIVTIIATVIAFRRFRFVAYGMLIPLLGILLVALGIFLLCSRMG